MPAITVWPGMYADETMMESDGNLVEGLGSFWACVVLSARIADKVVQECGDLTPVIGRHILVRRAKSTGPLPCLTEHAAMQLPQCFNRQWISRVATKRPLLPISNVQSFPCIEL